MTWPLDQPALARFANRRLMRTCDLLLATLTLILALEGKDRTVAMLEQQLQRLRRDQIVPQRYSG